MISLSTVRSVLSNRSPLIIKESHKRHAAVAMILVHGQSRLKLLFIERAKYDNDPWSGNLAFPGGHIEPLDAGPKAAAERETREEIGLGLEITEYLGRLDDIVGTSIPVLISCFVYGLPAIPTLMPNREVSSYFWFPVRELCNPLRHKEVLVGWNGTQRDVQSIDLLGPERPVLWGLTYRLVGQLLALINGDLVLD